MRIGIFGNCQTASFRESLSRRVKNHEFYNFVAETDLTGIENCTQILMQNDYYNNQSYLSGIRSNSDVNFIRIPTFYFAGLHPDLVFERTGDGQHLTGPAGSLNSAIILHGFLHGFTEEETASLFNRQTYETLGYDNYWNLSIQHMISELNDCGLPGLEIVKQWEDLGRFAHTVNHPTIGAIDIVCEELIKLLDWSTSSSSSSAEDPLLVHGVWPIYPGLAASKGLDSNLDFRFGPLAADGQRSEISLKDFIAQSYCRYAEQASKGILVQRFEENRFYGDLKKPKSLGKNSKRDHVYSNLPSTSFWRQSIAQCEPEEVDPVSEPRFRLTKADKIATAGSCFAQHIAKTLTKTGYNYYVAEAAPAGRSQEWAQQNGYGLFSARYGNIYTARQLRQLVERCLGTFSPLDTAWQRPDGRFIDPFRPQLDPDGYASVEQVERAAMDHLDIVRAMFSTADVFVFTLGLTESWSACADGATFPIAPGIVAGEMDEQKYKFVNFSCLDVINDLSVALSKIRSINEKIKVILTVSPVPLIATYEKKHVLVATTYSKSSLRAAAEEIRNTFDFVEYFPSYEIITGSYNSGRYFKLDKREVTPQGVARVMHLLAKHFFSESEVEERAEAEKPSEKPRAHEKSMLSNEFKRNSAILCDEELLASP